jgi:hypothetical protein
MKEKWKNNPFRVGKHNSGHGVTALAWFCAFHGRKRLLKTVRRRHYFIAT